VAPAVPREAHVAPAERRCSDASIAETSWTFLRHGQSHANAEGWLSGWDDVQLTHVGQQQARDAGAALRQVHFVRCLTSDLGRARHTAELVLDGRPVPIHVSAALRERHMGVLQREPWAIVKEDGRHTRWLAPWDVGPPDGESHRDAVSRAFAFLRAWDDGQPTLVVAHGSLLRGILAVLRGEELAQRLSTPNAVPETWRGAIPWPPVYP
jgi:2,3-bisphosphoglycerate-dependent phosphoglycerate mutase